MESLARSTRRARARSSRQVERARPRPEPELGRARVAGGHTGPVFEPGLGAVRGRRAAVSRHRRSGA
jgi:hypothetical protein